MFNSRTFLAQVNQLSIPQFIKY